MENYVTTECDWPDLKDQLLAYGLKNGYRSRAARSFFREALAQLGAERLGSNRPPPPLSTRYTL